MGDSFALARFPVGCADVWRGAPSAAPTRATLLAPFLLASPICAPALLASSLSPAPPLPPLAWSSRAPRRAARLRLAGCLGAAGSPGPPPSLLGAPPSAPGAVWSIGSPLEGSPCDGRGRPP